MKIPADSSTGSKRCSMPSATARVSFLTLYLAMTVVARHLLAPIPLLQQAFLWRGFIFPMRVQSHRERQVRINVHISQIVHLIGVQS
jgi:hypothetical protein